MPDRHFRDVVAEDVVVAKSLLLGVQVELELTFEVSG
jgi:hypothetical protein